MPEVIYHIFYQELNSDTPPTLPNFRRLYVRSAVWHNDEHLITKNNQFRVTINSLISTKREFTTRML